MDGKSYSKDDIVRGYNKLIYARGLIEGFLVNGFDINKNKIAATEGFIISVFNILYDYLSEPEDILDGLQCGYSELFTNIWNEENTKEAEHE